MRYSMKEKFWSFGAKFNICDVQQQPVYVVSGQPFSWGSKLSLQDTGGKELAFISQKLLSWKPRYEIFRGGQLFAEVVKEFSWFNKIFTLDVPGPNDYSIEGSFWQHEYSFVRGGQQVASVSKQYFSWTDTYGIDIVDGDDDVAILATVIVIDQVLHNERRRSG
ncbi:MAG: hypothetical protein Aurels2KO_43330 [Aureliella sp.]